MRKKFLLGLASMISAFMLTACVNGGDDSAKTSTTPATQTETTKPETSSNTQEQSSTTTNAKAKYTVAVTNTNAQAGSVTGTGEFEEGSSVTLTATPNTGYVFLGFYNGDTKVSTGDELTYSFTLSSNVTLSAKWEQKFTVAVTKNIDAAGTISGDGEYVNGTEVTLTATSNTGYTFLGFFDGDTKVSTGDELTYTFTLDADANITAKWELQKFTVAVGNANTNAGTVSGAGEYGYGTEVTLTATPKSGYTFLGFYDGETKVSTGNDLTYTFTITDNASITAKWTVQSFTLSVTSEDAAKGSVSYDAKESYTVEDVIKLTATPETGYVFDGWYIGTERISPDAELDFTMIAQNTEIVAKFAVMQCSLGIISNFDAPAEYEITVDGDNGIYGCGDEFDYGTTVSVKCLPESGMTFKGFYTIDANGQKDQLISSDIAEILLDDSNIVIFADFESNKIEVLTDLEVTSNKPTITDSIATITVVDADGNTHADGLYEYKSKVTISLNNLSDGFTFEGWYIYNDESGEYELYSEFEEFDYYIKASDNDFLVKVSPKKVLVTVVNDTPELGTISLETGEFEFNEVLAITATPIEGHVLDEIVISGVTDPITDASFNYKITSVDEIVITVSFKISNYDVKSFINVAQTLDSDVVADFTSANDGERTYKSELTLSAPTIQGYTFVGWYEGKFVGDDEKAYATADLLSEDPDWTFAMFGKDINVTACYTRNKFTVRYNPDADMSIKDDEGDEVVLKTGIEYGLNYKLAVPTKDQYVFLYWYYEDENTGKAVKLTNAQGESLAPWTMIIDGRLNVYPKTEKDSVIVTFNTQGGSKIDDQPVVIGHSVSRPTENPTREGYTFVDWFTTEDGDTKWNFATPISSAVTIYAHWTINQYDLTVTSQNASVVAVNTDASGSYDYGTKVTLSATISDSGYSFVGWELDGEIISTEANFIYIIPADESVLKATYKVNTYTVTTTTSNWAGTATVTVDSENGIYSYKDTVTVTIKPQAGYYVQSISLNGSSITFTGNAIDGYSAQFSMPSRNTTVTVYMDCNMYTYTVSKDVPEGTAPYFLNSTYSTHYTSTKTYWAWQKTLVASEIAGYRFLGWYDKETNMLIDDDATTLTYVVPQRSTIIGPKNAEIEARYEANTYNINVTKDVNGSVSNIYSGKLAYKGNYVLETTAITGYTFQGWFVNGSSTAVSTALKYTYPMPAGDVSIVAKYTINKYNVTVSTVSGNTTWTINPGTATVTNGTSTTTLPRSSMMTYNYNTKLTYTITNTVDGYEFVGWYVGTTQVSTSATYTMTVGAQNYQVYPTWKPKQYNVVYSANGGTTSVPGVKATMGEAFTLEVPVFEGRTFSGWYYVDDDLNAVFVTDANGKSLSFYNIPARLDVSAAWGVSIQTVTFDTQGGSTVPSANVEYNKTVARPDDPTRKGYTFKGWYNGDEEWVFTSPVTADLTLTAKWEINKYKATLYLDYDGYGTFEYYVNATTKGTISSTSDVVELELDFGTTIKLTAHPYLGRKLDCWLWGTNTDGGEYYDASYDDSFEYGENVDIVCSFCSTDEMKYFSFTSDNSTVTITGANTSYTSVTTLVVPDIVTQINPGALAKFTKLYRFTAPFTGTSRDATGENKLFAVIFGTTSGDNLTSRNQYYLKDDVLTKATVRYVSYSLTYITITDEEEIAPCAFYNMQARGANININEGITKIGKYAFYYCYMSSFTFPKSIEVIDDYAFMNAHLVNVVVPNDNVSYIGKGVFANSSSDQYLTTISLPFVGSSYSAEGSADGVFGWIFDGQAASSSYSYAAEQKYGATSTTRVTYYIPNKLTTITINPKDGESSKVGYGAFMNLKNVTTISAPYHDGTNNTSAIQAYAFYGCESLTSITGTILERCSSINTYAFFDCVSLENFILPSTCTSSTNKQSFSIGSYAFYDCFSLTTVEIGTSWIGSIGDYAFYECEALQEFKFPYVNGYWMSIGTYAFSYCINLKSYAAHYISTINSYAFDHCTSLTSFTMTQFNSTSTTTQICEKAFNYCTSLTKIEIPKAYLKYVGPSIFAGCYNLTDITMPFVGKDANGSTTTESGDYVYGYWFGTTSNSNMWAFTQRSAASTNATYYVPNKSVKVTLTNVKDIPAWAFGNPSQDSNISTKTITVEIKGFDTSVSTHTIGNSAFYANFYLKFDTVAGITDIGNMAFYRCYALYQKTNLFTTSASTLKTIGTKAFWLVDSTVDLVLFDGLTVGDNAFAEGARINSITIGKNVTLGENVFYKANSSVTNVKYAGTAAEYAVDKANWNSNWFGNSSIASITTSDNQTYILNS